MKVQVLLSAYNGEQFIQEQIESIMQQSGVEVSLLIRDDGSTDNTCDILEEIQVKYPACISIVKGENKGVTQSFFELLKLSDEKYDYYAFSDQDDVWFENKLITACNMIQVNNIKNQSQPFLYVGNYTLVNNELLPIQTGNAIDREISFPKTIVENIALGCTMVMNKSLRDAFISKEFPPAIIHDWYMYLLAQTIGDVYVDENPTMFYRQHANNVIGNKKQGIHKNLRKLLEVSEWAQQNHKQLQFILMHYADYGHQEKIKMLEEYTTIKNKPLNQRIYYNRTRKIRRTSKIHDIVLSVFILLKKI
ncbi:MAG: glycosyltransferase family 2 protein [Culicoidibacterales bacterium]